MEKIAKIAADLEGWFKELGSLQIKNTESLRDSRNFHAASMLLFSIINGAIKIGEEVISLKRLGFPSSYKEIFGILEKNKIISGQLSREMAGLVVYRNMFAHQYWSFSEKDVWKALKKVHAVKLFVVQAKKFLGGKK